MAGGSILLFLLVLSLTTLHGGCAGVVGSGNPSGPTVSITSPTSGTTVSASITVSANAPANTVGVQFKLDGANLGSEKTSAPFSITWDTTTTANGQHILTAVARNGAGQTPPSASVTVTVSNSGTSLTVTMTAPANGASVSGTIAVSASASTTSPASIAGVQFLLDGANLGSEVLSAPYSISWDSTTVANGSHTLAARARGTAGTTALSISVTVTVSNGSGASDFQTRCNAPGVVRCVGFDSAADIAGTPGSPVGIQPGAGHGAPANPPIIDTTIKASGAGSLRFTVPADADSDVGSFFANFSDDLLTQFGENSEFWVQYRQRFSPEIINNRYFGTNGFKNDIIGTGDQPGCTPSFQANCASSCSDIEIETGNYTKQGFPIMYDGCAGSEFHGAYDGFYLPIPPSDFDLQNGRPAPLCLYSVSNTIPASALPLQGSPPIPSTAVFPPNGNCFGYYPNEWMTFQIHVKVGPRTTTVQADNWQNSFVQLYMAREGQPSQLVIDWGPYYLTAGTPASNQKFGKVYLLPYMTGKCPASATIGSLSRAGSVSTVHLNSPFGHFNEVNSECFTVGDSVTISGTTVDGGSFNGTFPIASLPNNFDLTFTQSGNAVSSTASAGTAVDNTLVYPVAYTWYDELIVSRQRILDPK